MFLAPADLWISSGCEPCHAPGLRPILGGLWLARSIALRIRWQDVKCCASSGQIGALQASNLGQSRGFILTPFGLLQHGQCAVTAG